MTGNLICHCEGARARGNLVQELPNSYKLVRLRRLPLRGRGRLRAPPVADEASKKEWQNQGNWQAGFACADRAADSTG